MSTLRKFGERFADTCEALIIQSTCQEQFDDTPMVFQADGMYFSFTDMFMKDGVIHVTLTKKETE